MAKSMTGFGRGEITLDNVNYSVEVKSVNHRYFEFSVRMPKSLGFLEEKLKSHFSQSISRGKVEVHIGIDGGSSSGVIEINETVAEGYIEALKTLKRKFGLKGSIKLSDVVRNPDIFSVKRAKINEEEMWKIIKDASDIAIASFVDMRILEGEKLVADITSRTDFILEKIAFIEKSSPETLNKYRERLEAKMKELLGDVHIDEQRLLTETAIFADKIAVDEETVRLKSHISQLKDLLSSNDAIGRKLDFVVQEMNRETNTIGSKAQDLSIAHTVVDIKAEIEKIREQIQNIE